MARKTVESYCAVESDRVPRCAIPGCTGTVVAEVFSACYSEALRVLRGIDRRKNQSRRPGDERLFACAVHMEHDERMVRLLWQLIIPVAG